MLFAESRKKALEIKPIEDRSGPQYATGMSTAKLPVKQTPFVLRPPYTPGQRVGGDLVIVKK